MHFRFMLAMLISKLSVIVLSVLKRNATNFPGKIAARICPDFMGRIQKPAKIIAVTGTNGKTTVCNIICDILIKNNIKVTANRFGANINSGVASALIKDSTLFGKAKNELAVFEIDERSSHLIYPYIKPDFIIITNIFRDSIKRNAHTEYISGILNSSIPKTSKIITNADDLIAACIAPGNPRVFFGISRLPSDLDECINIINDVQVCPECRSLLKYDYVRYHHIGFARCPQCGLRSPESDYTVTDIDPDRNTITVRTEGKSYDFPAVSSSIFNIYNETAVIALFNEMGYDNKFTAEMLSQVSIVETRFSSETAGGIELITHMAKGMNPVACSRVFDYISTVPGPKELILILDDVFDAKVTSENITWIFETDFEYLNRPEIRKIIIGGVRAQDYRLRLLMAGVDDSKLICTAEETDTPKHLDCIKGEQIYILHELYAADTAFKIRELIKTRLAGAA